MPRRKHQKLLPNPKLNPRKSNRLPKKQEKRPKHQLKLQVKKSRLLLKLPLRKSMQSLKKLKPSKLKLKRKLIVIHLMMKPLQQLQLRSQLPKPNKNKKVLKKTPELLQRKVKNQTKINFSNLTSKLTQSDNDQVQNLFRI